MDNATTIASVTASTPPNVLTQRVRTEEEWKKLSHQECVDSVAKELAELASIDITAPENVPQVGTLMTRMLLLDFVACAASITRPDEIDNVTYRTADFFNKNSHNKTLDTYLWGVRMYSELNNCRTLVESRIEATVLLLDLLLDHPGTGTEFDRIETIVLDTVCYIKAYNLLMDIAAKKLGTPELALAKKDTHSIILLCKVYNKSHEVSLFYVDYLIGRTPKEAKTEMIQTVNRTAATLFSAMVSGYNVILADMADRAMTDTVKANALMEIADIVKKAREDEMAERERWQKKREEMAKMENGAEDEEE